MLKLLCLFLILFHSHQIVFANSSDNYNFTDQENNQVNNKLRIVSTHSLDVENLNEYKKLVPLKTVGTAKFSVLFWDIYQSTLLSSTGAYPIENKQQQLLFEITYLKDITKKDLIERTIEQWQHIGHTENDFGAFVPELETMWPNIKAGDSLALLVNDKASVFYFNQQKIGEINNDEFGRLFLNIWLAHNTSQPQLRAQLLGKQSS